MTIQKALENIHERRYLLPAIQREFVWAPDQIERLFGDRHPASSRVTPNSSHV